MHYFKIPFSRVILNYHPTLFIRYPRNQNCVWNITADEGYFVVVDFDDFKLEEPQPSGFCPFDYVAFSGGKLRLSI